MARRTEPVHHQGGLAQAHRPREHVDFLCHVQRGHLGIHHVLLGLWVPFMPAWEASAWSDPCLVLRRGHVSRHIRRLQEGHVGPLPLVLVAAAPCA